MRDYDLADLDDDNYRFAIALILDHAASEALLERQGFIIALPMFPDQLRGPLDERLEMLCWDWDRGWAALEALGQDTMRRGGFSENDVRYAYRILGSLARQRVTKAASVLHLLRSLHHGRSRALWRWLEPLIVNLAGVMRLESAVPLLVERLAHAVLSHRVEEGVEPVRQLVCRHDQELTPDGLEIRYRLVVACSIMGTSFPEYEKTSCWCDSRHKCRG